MYHSIFTNSTNAGINFLHFGTGHIDTSSINTSDVIKVSKLFKNNVTNDADGTPCFSGQE